LVSFTVGSWLDRRARSGHDVAARRPAALPREAVVLMLIGETTRETTP
jgi:hypothetical protein